MTTMHGTSALAEQTPWGDDSGTVLIRGETALPITEDQRAIFQRHTERRRPPATPAREAWGVVGRRGGKSRIAALVAVYLACFRDYRRILAPGERGTLPIIAADRRQ